MFFWAKYGTQTAIRFPMVKRAVVDLAATADWTPATGDTKVSKDGGSFANTTNNPAAVGGTGSVGWTLTLTATELQAAEVNVQIVDSATKAVEDQFLTVYTYGNASAKVQVDLSDAVRAGLTALPNAAAEAAGGLYTRGTGAGQIAQDANGNVRVNLDTIKTQAVTCAAGVTVLASVGTAATSTAQTGDAFARLGAPAGASVSADVAAVKSDTGAVKTKTDFLPSATAGAAGGVFIAGTNAATTITTGLTTTFTGNLTGSVGSLAAQAKADVNAEVDTAIVDARLDELLAADSDIDGLAPPTVGSVFHELLTKTAGSFTYDQATDSLEAIRDKETDIETDTAEIGAAGAGLTNINLPDQAMNITGNITGSLSGSVGSVTGAVGSVTAAVTVGTNNDKTGYALTAAYDPAKTAAQAGDEMDLVNAPNATALTAIANSHLDQANGVEVGLTPRQAHRLEAAAAAGKLSGAATTTVVIRNAVADSKNRISATVDGDGNRSAVSTDVT